MKRTAFLLVIVAAAAVAALSIAATGPADEEAAPIF